MAIEPSTIRHLFVYGTLRPGDVRWHFLQPFVADEGWPDAVAGAVYDTGLDYPAAVLCDSRRKGSDGPAGSCQVHGQTYALLESSLEQCLEILDDVEGVVDGEYRRVPATTRAGVRAWIYEYGSGLDLTLIESGDWLAR